MDNDDEIPPDDDENEKPQRRGRTQAQPEKEAPKRKYPTGKPKKIHPIVRRYTDWVRAQQLEAELLGMIPVPMEVIDEFIEPSAQRLFEYLVPEGLASDIIAVASPTVQAYSISKLGQVARRQGATVKETEEGARLVMPDGQTVREHLHQRAADAARGRRAAA